MNSSALKRKMGLPWLRAMLRHATGHFYSPVVDFRNPLTREAVRSRADSALPSGVKIDLPEMEGLLRRLARQHRHFQFPRKPDAAYRFHFDNPYFGCHDASVLFSMLLEFKPRRVVEIGCGYSSCLLLDTNERFLNGELDLTLVDPYLRNAERLFGKRGSANARLIRSPVQDLSLVVIERLEADDILFLDSSHVSKTASDVNYVFFKIFPLLKPGVLIHIHDILYPFEYPEDWILKERRSWNEAYVLRAFLQYNSCFEIIYWNSFVWHRLHEELGALMPLCLENEGGSIWLRRVG